MTTPPRTPTTQYEPCGKFGCTTPHKPHVAPRCGTCGIPDHYAGDNRHDCGALDKLCVCGHRQNRHTEYGCIDCGSSEASTRQHDFKRPVHFPGYDSALAAITEGAKP